jgi:hypothetical protein
MDDRKLKNIKDFIKSFIIYLPFPSSQLLKKLLLLQMGAGLALGFWGQI